MNILEPGTLGTNFANLRMYQLAEELSKALIDELTPKLNAHLRSIGQRPDKSQPSSATDNRQRTRDYGPRTTDQGLRTTDG
jgi:hypothetical protein